MQKNDEWLTVKQFASTVGVSTQRIYQRIAKDLQSYCKEENGSKYINIDAAKLFGNDAGLQNHCKALDKGLQSVANPEIDKMRSDIEQLQAKLSQAIADLENERSQHEIAERRAAAADAECKRADAAEQQCSVKDKQIEALTAALQTAQAQAVSLTEALTAAQALHAGTIQERLTEQSSLQGELDIAANDGDKQLESLEDEPIKEKKGLLSRIFGKNK